MAKKCIPGVICIEHTTFGILALIVCILIYMHVFFVSSYPLPLSEMRNKEYVVVPPPPIQSTTSLVGIPSRLSQNILNDPFIPPTKTSLDIRGDVITRGIPVNIQTRGLNMDYEQIGILTGSKSGQDLILPLMGRRLMTGRDRYQYYSISNTGVLNTKLPISKNNKNCTSEYGCNELYDGDDVFVKGYNNMFRVTLYDNNLLNYIPYL